MDIMSCHTGQIITVHIPPVSASSSEFWPTLEEYLPSVKLLQLKSDVSCQLTDMLSFCSKTTAHPITIELCAHQYQELVTAGFKSGQ
jgi:hypothetical protein